MSESTAAKGLEGENRANTSSRDIDLASIVQFCEQTLGAASGWVGQVSYPNSLAMCVIDSIWSLSAHYDHHVLPVLERYRALRSAAGANADTDGPLELLETINELGGGAAFADALANHQLTSPRNGVLKAEAIRQAAAMFVELTVSSPAEFLELASRSNEIQQAWQKIPGQKSSLTGWRYLRLLAGAQEVKPDRMILRFVADAIGREATDDQAHDLVASAAAELDAQPRELDYQIWRYQSGRTRSAELS